MKITELENEAMLDALANVIEDAAIIFSNEKVVSVANKGGSKLEVVTAILRNCKKEILSVLAAWNCTPVKDFKCNLLSLMSGTMELLKTPEVMDFFIFAGLIEKPSGSVTENTEETVET